MTSLSTKSRLFTRAPALAAAAIAIGFAVLPMQSAEARYGRNGALAAGIVGGAILGGALLAPRAYGTPVYGPGPVYVEEPECYRVRERVWDEYRGRWVRVNRTVCD